MSISRKATSQILLGASASSFALALLSGAGTDPMLSPDIEMCNEIVGTADRMVEEGDAPGAAQVLFRAITAGADGAPTDCIGILVEQLAEACAGHRGVSEHHMCGEMLMEAVRFADIKESDRWRVEWNVLTRMAQDLENDGRLVEAQRILDVLTDIAEGSPESVRDLLTDDLLLRRASLYRLRRLYRDSEAVYRDLLRRCESEVDSCTLPAAGLALLYRDQGRYKEAARYFQWAQITIESMDSPDSAALVAILRDYAEVLDALGQPSRATELRIRAERISRRSD